MNPQPEHSLHLIREGSGVIAVWKPSGVATQAPPGIFSAERWIRQQLHGEKQEGYLGVPHRVDRAVSGVLLFAATPRAARKLSRQFERREIRKAYLAIVSGRKRDADGLGRQGVEEAEVGDGGSGGTTTWRDMVEKVPDEARARITPAGAAGGREAVTIVRHLATLPQDRLLLELAPVTGRMHQLRLQSAARGLPVVGDSLYGSTDDFWADQPGDDPRLRPIALHARRISYHDPDSGEAVIVEATLPDAWPVEAREAAAAAARSVT